MWVCAIIIAHLFPKKICKKINSYHSITCTNDIFASGLWENVLLHFNWEQILFLISNLRVIFSTWPKTVFPHQECLKTRVSAASAVRGTRAILGAVFWSLSRCLCRTPSAGSGLLVNVPEAPEFPPWPSASLAPHCAPASCPPNPWAAVPARLSPSWGWSQAPSPSAVPTRTTRAGSCLWHQLWAGWAPLQDEIWLVICSEELPQ